MLLPNKSKVMWVAKLTKQDWPCYNKNFGSKQLYATLKTKVLEYKVEELNLYALLCIP